MYADQVLKAQQYADTQAGKASPYPQTPTGGVGGSEQDGCCEKACRPRLLEQLQQNRFRCMQKQERQTRIIEILSRHPEFEEFLELQELLRTDVLY